MNSKISLEEFIDKVSEILRLLVSKYPPIREYFQDLISIEHRKELTDTINALEFPDGLKLKYVTYSSALFDGNGIYLSVYIRTK